MYTEQGLSHSVRSAWCVWINPSEPDIRYRQRAVQCWKLRSLVMVDMKNMPIMGCSYTAKWLLYTL